MQCLRRVQQYSILLSCTVLFIFSKQSYAADSVAKVAKIIGSAQVIREGQTLAIAVGADLFPKDYLLTGAAATLKVNFVNGESLVLFANSALTVEEYQVQEKTSAFGKIIGKVRFFVKPEKVSQTRLQTHNTVMGIRGTSGYIFANATESHVFLLNGTVEVYNVADASKSVLMQAGHMVRLFDKSPPPAPALIPQSFIEEIRALAAQYGEDLDEQSEIERTPPATEPEKEEEKAEPTQPQPTPEAQTTNPVDLSILRTTSLRMLQQNLQKMMGGVERRNERLGTSLNAKAGLVIRKPRH